MLIDSCCLELKCFILNWGDIEILLEMHHVLMLAMLSGGHGVPVCSNNKVAKGACGVHKMQRIVRVLSSISSGRRALT